MLTMFLGNPSKLDLKTEEGARTADKTAEERMHMENESSGIPCIFSLLTIRRGGEATCTYLYYVSTQTVDGTLAISRKQRKLSGDLRRLHGDGDGRCQRGGPLAIGGRDGRLIT